MAMEAEEVGGLEWQEGVTVITSSCPSIDAVRQQLRSKAPKRPILKTSSARSNSSKSKAAGAPACGEMEAPVTAIVHYSVAAGNRRPSSASSNTGGSCGNHVRSLRDQTAAAMSIPICSLDGEPARRGGPTGAACNGYNHADTCESTAAVRMLADAPDSLPGSVSSSCAGDCDLARQQAARGQHRRRALDCDDVIASGDLSRPSPISGSGCGSQSRLPDPRASPLGQRESEEVIMPLRLPLASVDATMLAKELPEICVTDCEEDGDDEEGDAGDEDGNTGHSHKDEAREVEDIDDSRVPAAPSPLRRAPPPHPAAAMSERVRGGCREAGRSAATAGATRRDGGGDGQAGMPPREVVQLRTGLLGTSRDWPLDENTVRQHQSSSASSSASGRSEATTIAGINGDNGSNRPYGNGHGATGGTTSVSGEADNGTAEGGEVGRGRGLRAALRHLMRSVTKRRSPSRGRQSPAELQQQQQQQQQQQPQQQRRAGSTSSPLSLPAPSSPYSSAPAAAAFAASSGGLTPSTPSTASGPLPLLAAAAAGGQKAGGGIGFGRAARTAPGSEGDDDGADEDDPWQWAVSAKPTRLSMRSRDSTVVHRKRMGARIISKRTGSVEQLLHPQQGQQGLQRQGSGVQGATKQGAGLGRGEGKEEEPLQLTTMDSTPSVTAY